jgi:hypothetical protein
LLTRQLAPSSTRRLGVRSRDYVVPVAAAPPEPAAAQAARLRRNTSSRLTAFSAPCRRACSLGPRSSHACSPPPRAIGRSSRLSRPPRMSHRALARRRSTYRLRVSPAGAPAGARNQARLSSKAPPPLRSCAMLHSVPPRCSRGRRGHTPRTMMRMHIMRWSTWRSV